MVKGFFSKGFGMLKPHAIFLALLLVITSAHFSVLFTSKMPYPPTNLNLTSWNQHDFIFFYGPRIMNMHQEILDGNYYPLWNKYLHAGQPLLADPELTLFNFPLLFSLFGFDYYLSSNLGMIIHILIAGLSMYFLANLVTKSKEAAFIAALIYANGGYYVWDVIAGAYAYMQAMSVIPLALICFYYIIFTEKYLIASLLAVLTVALIGSFSPTILVYFSILSSLIFLYFIAVSASRKKMFRKYFIAAVIVIPLALSLLAFKALPSQEFLDLTNRGKDAGGLSYEEAHRGIALKNLALIDPWISNKYNRQNFRDIYIGLAPFALILFAVMFKFRNKWVMLLSFSALLFLFISFGEGVYKLFYDYYPLISSTRRPQRFLTMAFVAGSLLASFGYLAFQSRYGKRISKILSKSMRGISSFLNRITLNKLSCGNEEDKRSCFNWSFLIIVILLVLNLNISSFNLNYVDMHEEISMNEAMNYIAEQPGVFRMQSWEMRGLEYGLEDFTQPLRIEHLYGYISVWNIDYFNIFMSYSFQNPARLWGMLNTKFITSMTELNQSGFKFVKKFKECPRCNPLKAAGPYLYENEEFLPRAYITNNAVLVYGTNKRAAQQLNYMLLLSQNYNPKNLAVITTNDPSDIQDQKFLSRFSAVFLTEAPPSVTALSSYHSMGGRVFPDVFSGEISINPESLSQFFEWSNMNSEYYPLEDYEEYIPVNSDEAMIRLKEPKKGFLVMGEQYSYYPGWHFRSGIKNLKLMKAADVLTAVYLDNEQNIDILYYPDSFRKGFYLSIAALAITLISIFYVLKNNKKNSKTEKTE